MPGKNSKGRPPDPGRVWNLDNIQQLLDLLADKEINEFEMEQQGVKIRVQRGVAPAGASAKLNGYVVASGAAQPMPVSVPATAPPAPSSETPAATAGETASESTEGLFMMKSPIVGTFYSSPSPSAPPFAVVGDTVRVGQVLCIIEAMKLMNELESEVAGKVVRVYCENGQPVEYGQSLFAIEPSRKK